ncbi:MAG: hypothetical protein FD123_103 [Bacteroidetes bacterium]|nr:MAG: hypothetical protein FD123_103 [Bacteroidota bacterium]
MKAVQLAIPEPCNAPGNEQTGLFPEKAFIKMGIVIYNED